MQEANIKTQISMSRRVFAERAFPWVFGVKCRFFRGAFKVAETIVNNANSLVMMTL